VNFAYLLWPPTDLLGEPPRWPLTARKPVSSPTFPACFFTIAPTSPKPRRKSSGRLVSDSFAAARSSSEPAHRRFAELKAVSGPEPQFGESGGPTATSSESSWKKSSSPVGLMVSIRRAGMSPAFLFWCAFPRAGLVMYPPAASTASRSPERKPISPSVRIEYSSSRVWKWGERERRPGTRVRNRELAVSNRTRRRPDPPFASCT
jgi:hypothetical protein